MKRRWSTAAVLALVWRLAALSGSAEPRVALTLENGAVVVSNFQPGAEVVYVDVYRFSAAYIPRNADRATIAIPPPTMAS